MGKEGKMIREVSNLLCLVCEDTVRKIVIII